MNRIRVLAAWLILSALVLPLVGCSEPEKTAKVSGKVTYKEKPVPGGTVTFINDKGKIGSATIESNGTYSSSNVPYGHVKVGKEMGKEMGRSSFLLPC